MKLHVTHLSRYEYERTVTFSPHQLYLRPRETPLLRVNTFGFNISPDAKIVWTRDSNDVLLATAYFWDGARALSIRTDFEVETHDSNPFDFILKPHATSFPFTYTPLERLSLSPYLSPPSAETQRLLHAWLQEQPLQLSGETVPFVTSLNRLLYSTMDYVRREDPGIQDTRTTLSRRSGACRDYAVLLADLCRTLGLAARFVSGYVYSESDDNHRSLGAMHAWTELYLPGAGWKGMDPTHGVLCDDSFIPVAHAPSAESVNPIQGNIYSLSRVHSSLLTEVRVEKRG
ncbi:MAG: transglutaminase family protein [Opitutaceae bacterium]|nr:transglutaminase family protein [Opitutaceae bacterium]